MKIIDLDNLEKSSFETGIALGNFDGLHRGHSEIIKNMVKESKEHDLKPALLLFKNHTKKTISNQKPAMITSLNQKIKVAEELGVEIVFLLEFTKEVMGLSEEEFIDSILVDKIMAKYIVVGFDYRFGFKARGTAQSLKELSGNRGIDVKIVSPVDNTDGEIISSTIIREAIKDGEVEKAENLLGRSFSLEGLVVDGKKRGKTLGFPTANLKVDEDYIIPKDGVYETISVVDKKEYKSITNIGSNPTFENDKDLKIETYILDFNQDIYNKEIEVKFKRFMRDDIKFNSREELIRQIEKDVNSLK